MQIVLLENTIYGSTKVRWACLRLTNCCDNYAKDHSSTVSHHKLLSCYAVTNHLFLMKYRAENHILAFPFKCGPVCHFDLSNYNLAQGKHQQLLKIAVLQRKTTIHKSKF